MAKEYKVDMSNLGKRLEGRRKPDGTLDINQIALAAGHQELPYDLPAGIEVFRIMGETKNKKLGKAPALEGWRVRVSVLGYGDVDIVIGRGTPRPVSVSMPAGSDDIEWDVAPTEEIIWDE